MFTAKFQVAERKDLESIWPHKKLLVEVNHLVQCHRNCIACMISENVVPSASISVDIGLLIRLWPDQQERMRNQTVWQQRVVPDEC